MKLPLRPSAGVTVVAMLVICAAIAIALSGSPPQPASLSRQPETGGFPPAPTSSLSPAERAFRSALVQASDWFFGGFGNAPSGLQSIVYVETTVGNARDFFSIDRRIQPQVGDDVPAWAFVGYGWFQHSCAAACPPQPTPTTKETLIVIIPALQQFPILWTSDHRYELGALGTPHRAPADQLEKLCDDHITQEGQASFCGAYAGSDPAEYAP